MDIAARNILFHEGNVAKISDFGIVSIAWTPCGLLYRCAAFTTYLAHCLSQTRRVDPTTKKLHLKEQLKLAVRWLPPETLGKPPLYFSGDHTTNQ